MEQIIYLEVDDDILTVNDRLRRAQSKQILVVIPVGCKGLSRALDFRLLRRQVAALSLDIALISDSAALRDLAVREGLTVFPRLSMGRRLKRRPSQWQPKDVPGLEGLVARLKAQRRRWWYWAVGPVAMVVVLGALLGSILMVWPSATIQVTPVQEPVGVSVWIEGDPSARIVDWERMRLPARVVQVEVVDRDQVETTGITNVAAERAVGSVVFVNLTQRDLSIPVDTFVSTSAGTPVRFRTTQQASVGPRGRATVAIEALEGGPGGNVRSNLINRVEGGLSASLRVTNERATAGGTTDQVHRVTHGDKQRVSDLLIGKLLEKGHAELSSMLEDEFVPVEAMWINEYSIRTNYDHHVDDQSDTLALEMRAVVGGIAISEADSIEMARRALSRQVRGGFHLLPDTVHVSRSDLVEVDSETGIVRYVMDGVALMEADIDVALLLKAIRGRPIDQALAYIRQTLPVEGDATLLVEPTWMTRVPVMAFRIDIVQHNSLQEMASALPGP